MEDTTIPISRALVVPKLGNTMLLSVRGLKRDGINTYMNDDNSIGRSDCLLVKSTGMVIPFTTGNQYSITSTAECGRLGESDQEGDANTHSRSRQVRNLQCIHSGLGYAGSARLNASKIVIDGVKVSSLEHDSGSCKGCRLGNTGAKIVPHKR